MAHIKAAIALTLAHEGYYANDPTDRGGETYRGIARKHHPAWHGWKVIDACKLQGDFKKNLSQHLAALEELVANFYKKEYWDKNNLDLVSNQAIANELFDTGVNMGVGTAAKYLQQALNLCNRAGRDYPNIEVDGDVGPTTLRTLNGHSRPKSVLKALNVLQGMRYVSICSKDESQEKYFHGWLERVEA